GTSRWAAQMAWLSPRFMRSVKLTPTSLPRNSLAGLLPGSCRISQRSTCNFVTQVVKRPREKRKKDPDPELCSLLPEARAQRSGAQQIKSARDKSSNPALCSAKDGAPVCLAKDGEGKTWGTRRFLRGFTPWPPPWNNIGVRRTPS